MNKILVSLLFTLAVMYGQQPSSDTLSMTATPPSGVQSLSVSTVGVSGGNTYCYWVVAVFAGGMDAQPKASCTSSSNGTLTGGNYNTINWTLASSATGYWVIRTLGNSFPGSGTVAVNTTVLSATTSTLNDQSNTLHSFTWAPMARANATFTLANTGGFLFPNVIGSTAYNITYFSMLPSAASKPGVLYVIYDSPSATSCSGGGGTGTPSLCLSNGVTWIPMATSVSGGTTTIQTNGVNNSSQNPVNFTNSNVFNGLTFTQTNTAGGIVQLGATGTLNTSGLTDASLFVFNNQANTYTGGSSKQTFINSSSVAPIRMPGTPFDPSVPATGDIWWRSDIFTLNSYWGGVTGRMPYVLSSVTPVAGNCLTWAGSGSWSISQAACGAGSGTVTNFSAGNLSPYFTTSVATSTSTPALSFTANTFLADGILGNFTGSAAIPTIQAVPACANDGVHALVYVSHILTCAALTTGGAGTVTSVGFTGGLISVATATTTPAFTVAGTSGGIPYFSSASTWASSGVLGANLPMFGGGAGSAPIAGTRSGNTTEVATVTGSVTSNNCAKWDASGNIVDAGTTCSGGAANSVFTGSTATAPSFSATPTFSLADVSVKSPVRVEAGTLTANVTAVTFTNKTAGAKFSLVWTQDGTGGRTVTYGSASNTCVVDPTASIATTQFLEVASDGTTVNGVGCTTNNTGVTGGPETVAPGTPTASNWYTWVDSTNHVLSLKTNNSGTVSNTVVPSTCGGSNFVSGISVAGVLTCTTPAGSGTVTTTGSPTTGNLAVFTGATSISDTTTIASTNVVVKNAANTFSSSGTVNLSSASATAGLVVPVASGASPTTAGGVAFDSSITHLIYGDGTNRNAVEYLVGNGATALGTGAISGNSCATAVTVSTTGVAATDVITFTPNADISGVTGYGILSTDGLKIYPYPTTNNVNFKVCNGTGTSITPGAVTLNWRVTR